MSNRRRAVSWKSPVFQIEGDSSSDDEDENRWTSFFSAMALGATLADGAYGLFQVGETHFTVKDDLNQEKDGSSNYKRLSKDNYPREKHPSLSSLDSEPVEDENIVIAVHTSNTRMAGLLRIPRSRQIHFYSIDWRKKLEEENSSNFLIAIEKINAGLSLEVFEPYLKNLKFDYQVVCKSENAVCLTKGDEPNPGKEKVHQTPFSSEWQHTPKLANDPDMKIAEMLTTADLFDDAIKCPSLLIEAVSNSRYFRVRHGNRARYTVQNVSEKDGALEVLGKMALSTSTFPRLANDATAGSVASSSSSASPEPGMQQINTHEKEDA